jgi:hypothetical protein
MREHGKKGNGREILRNMNPVTDSLQAVKLNLPFYTMTHTYI